MPGAFHHRDGAQTVYFGAGALEAAAHHFEGGFTLLTTPRAEAAAPALVHAARAVVHVPQGAVDEVAAQVRQQVEGGLLVALGGGRVIDVAKAVAAADELPGPVAIPTSLSGAEMTGVHRHARGVDASTPRVRAAVVVNDPALSASQPIAALAASSANALGHAVTAALSDRSSPITAAVATDAIRYLADGWAPAEPDRATIALGALMAGWAVDRSGLGLHHALAQTVVRVAGIAHADGNAAVLPHTIRELRRRSPEGAARLDVPAGGSLESFAEQLRARAGEPTLADLARDEALLGEAVETAARRPELAKASPPLDAGAIRRLYRTAALATH